MRVWWLPRGHAYVHSILELYSIARVNEAARNTQHASGEQSLPTKIQLQIHLGSIQGPIRTQSVNMCSSVLCRALPNSPPAPSLLPIAQSVNILRSWVETGRDSRVHGLFWGTASCLMHPNVKEDAALPKGNRIQSRNT